jgi:GH43 family beta-xylosidase
VKYADDFVLLAKKEIVLQDIIIIIFFVVQQPLLAQGILFISASRSHTDTPHSVGVLWTSDKPEAENHTDKQQHSQETDIHVPGGIQTRNPSKRAAADPRLRPHGHWDRQA